MIRLQEHFRKVVIPSLMQKFSYKQCMAVPKIEKICINMGISEASRNKKLLTASLDELELITGQKAVSTKSRKGIAAFKTRVGWVIGAKVTLRRRNMYEFLDRLISITIPRIRDFRGFSSNSFDQNGNFNFGIKEHIAFPEIDFDNIESIKGMNITITTSAKSKEEAQALLKAFNFPIK